MTGVNPIRTHGLGIWGNRRVVMGIRVDEKLKIEATKVLKALYGSTCRGIEAYLAGLVATYQTQVIEGVNPSNTISIGKIVIERNLRPHRKLEVMEEVAEKVTETKVVERVKRVVKTVDYGKCDLEQLQKLYDRAVGSQNHVTHMMVAAEFNRRGLKPVKHF